jgi:hypothetical protein
VRPCSSRRACRRRSSRSDSGTARSARRSAPTRTCYRRCSGTQPASWRHSSSGSESAGWLADGSQRESKRRKKPAKPGSFCLGAEEGIRTPTLLRAPAPQAERQGSQSPPTSVKRGRLSSSHAVRGRSRSRFAESVAQRCTRATGGGRRRRERPCLMVPSSSSERFQRRSPPGRTDSAAGARNFWAEEIRELTDWADVDDFRGPSASVPSQLAR